LRRTALCGSLLTALTSLAAPASAQAPAVVPHPLVVVGGSDDDAARFGPQLDAELSRHDVKVVPAVRAAVRGRTSGWKLRGTSSVWPSSPAPAVASGRSTSACTRSGRRWSSWKLVRSDGLLERSVSNLEVSRPKGRLRPEMIRPGIERVLTEGLRVETLDLQPLVAPPLAAAVDPPASSVPAEPRAEVPPAAPRSGAGAAVREVVPVAPER
jgi:hypothetical protein